MKTPFLDASIDALEKLGALQLPPDKPRLTEMKQIKEALAELERVRGHIKEYATFAVECDRRGLPVLEYDGWLKLTPKSEE